MRRRRSAWLLTLALVGCAEPETDCPALEVCAITEASCQQAIMATVSCMRGGMAAVPTVRVVSEAELLERFAGRDTRTAEQRARYERWLHGLSLFRMAPESYSNQQASQDSVSQIGAVYLGDTQEILVVDRGDSLATKGAVGLFAHELTHALQDAEHDLRGWRDKWVVDDDTALSTDAVVEGEAVFYQLMTQLELDQLSWREIDWEAYFTRWRSEQLVAAETDASPYSLADLRFPYAFGGGFVMQQWLHGGIGALRELWERPPLSTREVMFGPFAIDAARREQQAQRALPSAGEGFELVGSSHLGSWLTRQLVARIGVPVVQRLQAAEALAYDTFTLQANPSTGELVAGWHFDFSEDRALPPLAGITGRAEGPREWYLVGADPARDLQTVAWGPFPEANQQAAGQAASVRWAPPPPHAGCNVIPPEPRDAHR